MAQTTVDTLLIKIQADMAGLQREMGKVKKSVDSGSKDINRSLSSINSKISSTISNFAKVGAAIGVAFTGVAIRNIVKTGSEIEQLEIRLSKMFGSASEGALAFEGMSQFASKVPFSLQQIQQGAGSLSAVARDAEHLNQLLEITGNVAAVSGLDFATTSMQIQRAFSAGIGAADLFRERAVGSLIGFKQGAQVSVSETVTAFEEAFSGTGKFAGTTDELANTLTGTLSMIGDKIFNFQRLIADKGFFNEVKAQFQGLDDILAENEDRFKQLAEDISLTLVSALRGLVSALAFVQDNTEEVKTILKVTLGVILAYKAVTTITAIILGLKTAMIALGIETKRTGNIFKRNPVGLLVSGFALLSTAILGAKSAMSSFNQELANTREGMGTLNPFLGISEEVKTPPSGTSTIMASPARPATERRLKFEELKKEVEERTRLLGVTEAQRRLENLIGEEQLGDNHKALLLELIREEIKEEERLEEIKEERLRQEKQAEQIEKDKNNRLKEAISLTDRFKTEEQLLLEDQKKLNDAIAEFGMEKIPNAQIALDGLRHEIEMLDPVTKAIADSVDRAFDGIAASIADSMTHGKNALESLKDVARNVINEMIKEFIRLQMVQARAILSPSGGSSLMSLGGSLLSGLAGGLGGLFGGSSGVTVNASSAAGMGNAFTSSQLAASGGFGGNLAMNQATNPMFQTSRGFSFGNLFRQSGGTVMQGMPTVVGERGAEVFVPNSSGRIMNSNMTRGLGGNNVTVNQVLNVETGVSQTVKAEMLNLLPMFKEETITAVAEARLRGGSFANAFTGGR